MLTGGWGIDVRAVLSRALVATVCTGPRLSVGLWSEWCQSASEPLDIEPAAPPPRVLVIVHLFSEGGAGWLVG